jgi:hypothetical protein
MSTSLAEYYRGVEAAAAALASAPATPSARAIAVHDAVQPLLAADGTVPRACHSGCAHCCHFPVGVTFAEASLLAEAVAADPEARSRVLDHAVIAHQLGWPALVGMPCPFLRSDHSCGVYAARPLPCRALASFDAEACAAAVRGQATVPRDEAAFWRGLGAAATLATSAPAGSRELRSAVAGLLLADPSPEARAEAFLIARAVP